MFDYMQGKIYRYGTSIIYFMILIAYCSRVRIQMIADFNTTISITVLTKLSVVSAGSARIDFITLLDKLKHVQASIHFKGKDVLFNRVWLYAWDFQLIFMKTRSKSAFCLHLTPKSSHSFGLYKQIQICTH